MVSLGQLFIASAFLINVIAAFPTLYSNSWDRSVDSVERNSSVIYTDANNKKRQTGRQLLQWSPDGTVLYLLGTLGPFSALPLELMQMIQVGSEASPAQVLLRSFHDYAMSGTLSPAAFLVFVTGQIFNGNEVWRGGVYGVSSKFNLWGFAFSFAANNMPNAADLQVLVDAIQSFAEQDGGVVMMVPRTNGFFHPANIGPSINLLKRTRNGHCPATIDLVKYATADVPQDMDYDTYIRWAGPCLEDT